MSNETRKKEELLKSISDLLDETIREYEGLVKSEIRMQPDENGGMAAEAKQDGDDAMKPLKKEGEEEEVVKDPEKDEEKEDEKKEEEDEDMEKEEVEEEKKDDEEEEKEDDDEKKLPFEKSEDDAKLEKAVESVLLKLFDRYGLTDGVAKSEKTEIKKSEAPEEEPKDEGRLDKIEKSIDGLKETFEKIAKRPASPRRSLDGLSFLQKSEEDKPEEAAQSKEQVLDKLLALQKGGDKSVTTQVITRFEQEGDIQLLKDRGIKI